VKVNIVSSHHSYLCRILLPLVFIFAFISTAHNSVCAQSPPESAGAEQVVSVDARIERARALAAAHHLSAAASELESVRATTRDDVVRNVTSVMLMSIYLEEGNYARAESLLEETFGARSAAQDGSIRTYFALAGQAVIGARSHLARYRNFGINVTDARLPAEAVSDLERLRSLLERMIAQAKEITRGNSRAYDSLALLEDVLGIRLSLARDSEDREKWEREYAMARQGLAGPQNQIASLGGMPPLSPMPNPSPAAAPLSSQTESSNNQSSESKIAVAGKGLPGEGTTNAEIAASSSEPDGTSAQSETSGSKTLTTFSLNERATKRVVPPYPSLARSSKIEGLVRVYVTVDESGRVISVLRSEGPVLLRRAAEDASRQWRFPPAAVKGKPVPIAGYIEFNFSL
jgi:TonB family protein